jgi:GTP-binding protein Era
VSAFRCGRIAVVGRPNVGKSTLVNALVGARVSITSRKAQTTRHRVLGILTTAAAQFVFVDTPGFQRAHRSLLNDRLNDAVRAALTGVDAVLWVLECGRLTDPDRAVLALLPEALPVVAALNKVDRLPDRAAALPAIAELAALRTFAAIVPVSAGKGWQLDVLLEALRDALPVGEPQYEADQLTDRDERFLAAEFIREQVFRLLGAEVPYATAVTIDRFEHTDAVRRIHATVLVDRDNQRALILGARGERMKAIASGARAEMERLFGGKVFLEVWIKVRSGWAADAGMLDRLGYSGDR